METDEDGSRNMCRIVLFNDLLLCAHFDDRPLSLEHIFPLQTLDIKEEMFGKFVFLGERVMMILKFQRGTKFICDQS